MPKVYNVVRELFRFMLTGTSPAHFKPMKKMLD